MKYVKIQKAEISYFENVILERNYVFLLYIFLLYVYIFPSVLQLFHLCACVFDYMAVCLTICLCV